MAPDSVLEALEEIFGAEASHCASRLSTLVGLWQRFGRVMNLTASLDPDALWQQVGEGMLGVQAMHRAGFSARDWVDVGSGGGFPGLVFAACLPGSGCLVEPRLKRFEFLEIAKTQLNLASLELLRARVEPIGLEGGRRWSVASARAVWAPDEWLRHSLALLNPGGLALVHLPSSAGSNVDSLLELGWTTAADVSSDSWRVLGLVRG